MNLNHNNIVLQDGISVIITGVSVDGDLEIERCSESYKISRVLLPANRKIRISDVYELDEIEPGELYAFIDGNRLIVSCKEDNASQILNKGVGDRLIIL